MLRRLARSADTSAKEAVRVRASSISIGARAASALSAAAPTSRARSGHGEGPSLVRGAAGLRLDIVARGLRHGEGGAPVFLACGRQRARALRRQQADTIPEFRDDHR
ncbi:hypothetical protein DK419_15735 [Methylobacterium terrae]|uniref:Uncharacterized protein n=1 Tax=Methylobacterium terrae TaxID=2202827 RepID=A0A2U8WQV6_9HYPH|nr:hypothetical protein DK419_15735 [Methylobacterium terrae]